jgi:hypothetical protein
MNELILRLAQPGETEDAGDTMSVQEKETRMSEQDGITSQHERFKMLVEENVQHLLGHGVTDDWQVRCYRSKETFQREFPDTETRERLLEQIASHLHALDVAANPRGRSR